jgi:hypothetical protein
VVQQFTHNIGLLIDQLDQARIPRPSNLTEVAKLTDYAVHTRYPYAGPQVDEAMYLEALVLATRAVDWAASIISPPNPAP